MNKSMVLGVTGLLLVPSMQVHADAMGKGMGFQAPQSQSGEHMQSVRAITTDTALSVILPKNQHENPQCESGGQPCADRAQDVKKLEKKTDPK